MATILLSAAGAAVGGAVGGTMLGIPAAAAGRFAGALVGQSIDQRLLGQGAEAVEHGRLDRLRLNGTGEGLPIAEIWGQTRIPGHVIWASRFLGHEHVSGRSSDKFGRPVGTEMRRWSYSISLAFGLCRGPVTAVTRVWADGVELALGDLNMRVHSGRADQLPDPGIEAVEGTGSAPAYRGIAYVVMENLDLGPFSNRIPQFNFEVARSFAPATMRQQFAKDDPGLGASPAELIQGVAMIPGTGEYSLATAPVHFDLGNGKSRSANIHSPQARADFAVSLERLAGELPACKAVSLVVSWFGNDLRCNRCEIRPKVEQRVHDGHGMKWQVAGLTRPDAQIVAQRGNRPVYGGTPCDAAVIEGIKALKAAGQAVLYYPFILMDQDRGNRLVDPHSGEPEQPGLPWRGRITTSLAPGIDGSPDQTPAARDEVAAFFGTASASDFATGDGIVTYRGPDEWRFRRFILHQAAVCAAAGGVDAFCIGSEMRGLTQIRSTRDQFPAVQALIALAGEVRRLLGPATKIGYAADWSEYFGFHPQDGSGDVLFHLDPLWAHEAIDFVGIDNYMPLADWRDGFSHIDAVHGSAHDLRYLQGNIEGGEGYDWFYTSDAARDRQERLPIMDTAFGEDWIYRYKDIRNWWQNRHFNRLGGVRTKRPTGWQPQSKPVWFTEVGCAAIDKGSNEPNAFADPKSSESRQPRFSNGLRDDLMQLQHLRALHLYWSNPRNNPASSAYAGRMIDMERCFVWAWDARPFPWFPLEREHWADGGNHRRGHWINGRVSGRSLASVIAEICLRAGLQDFDVSEVHGFVRGYTINDVASARAALQPLMLRYGFDGVERDGALKFIMRRRGGARRIPLSHLVVGTDLPAGYEMRTGSAEETTSRVQIRFFEADAHYNTVAEGATWPQDATHNVTTTDLAMVMTREEGIQTAERWLAEAHIARDTLRLALPPSFSTLTPGDVITLGGGKGPQPVRAAARWRIDRIDRGDHLAIEAVRMEPEVHVSASRDTLPPRRVHVVPPAPVQAMFLDLPLIRGNEHPVAPYLAVNATPWPGRVAVYHARGDRDFILADLIEAPATVGRLLTPMPDARTAVIDRGAATMVQLHSGALENASDTDLLAGANLAALGDAATGTWELFQFRDAQLVAERRYALAHRLRGRFGSDAFVPKEWPAGTPFVLLDARVVQMNLAASDRGQVLHYRIGPAARRLGDKSHISMHLAFAGNGLRPYRPVHLGQRMESSGDRLLHWIRQTRIEGERWGFADPPLGEDAEAWLIEVRRGSRTLRRAYTHKGWWRYDAQQQQSDGFQPGDRLAVAQISARFGPGPFASIRAG